MSDTEIFFPCFPTKFEMRLYFQQFNVNLFQEWRFPLKLKGNLFVCFQIWTVASLTYKQQKRVCEFFLSKYFFSRAIFVRSLHIFCPISKMFCNFSLRLNMEKCRNALFSALGPETEEQIK